MFLQLGKKTFACCKTQRFIIIFAKAEIIYPLGAVDWQYIMNSCGSSVLLFPRAKIYDFENIKISLLNTIISDWSNWLVAIMDYNSYKEIKLYF